MRGDEAAISLTLSPAQVREVMRAATSAASPSMAVMLTGLVRPASTTGEDGRLSRSLLRGLALLATVASSGRDRGIVELAEELQMSPSTAHRYAQTLIEVGLLERSPRTRRYRLTAKPPAAPRRRREASDGSAQLSGAQEVRPKG